MTYLEHYQKVMRGELEPSPVEKYMRLKLVSLVEGEAVYEMKVNEQYANPQGTCNGGVLGIIADIAMGVAYASTLNEGETFTMIEMKVNFFKPVWDANIRAVAKMYKRGNTIGYVHCDVVDQHERVVAHASSTCMTLRGDKAEGR